NEPYYCPIRGIQPTRRVWFATRDRVTIKQAVWLFRDNTGTNLQALTNKGCAPMAREVLPTPLGRIGRFAIYCHASCCLRRAACDRGERRRLSHATDDCHW